MTLPSGPRTYSYDVDDRIVSVSDAVLGNSTYSYDTQDRLTAASTALGQWSYWYDANGNRIQNTINGSGYAVMVDGSSNRVLAASTPETRDFVYSAHGQPTSVTGPNPATACGATVALGYSADGQLVSSNVLSAVYGPSGLRLQKTAAACAGGVRTNFVYDPQGRLLGEYDAAGGVIQETVWVGDTPVAVFKSNGTAVVAHYIYADNLNTPRAITNTAGQVVWRWDGEPFGATPANENPSGLGAFSYGLRFPGQYFDVETGFHQNRWREYDPKLGRYLQSDPIGLAGGLNTYLYALGDPLSLSDPTGLDVWLEGPGPGEPPMHQSISVGNPKTGYVSYSYGVTPGAFGDVYQDTSSGGPIQSYKKTTLQQDAALIEFLDRQVGTKPGFYLVTDICRSWSQKKFDAVPGVSSVPPVPYATRTGQRPTYPHSIRRYIGMSSAPVSSSSSSSGTSTFR